MRLKNVLLVVKDIEKSVDFYKELFGLNVVLDQGGNVIMTEGLVLQEGVLWRKTIGREIVPENHAAELYFEEQDIEGFIRKLEAYQKPVRYVTPLEKHSWGQQVVRFYDPDGNLIEVGTPAGKS